MWRREAGYTPAITFRLDDPRVIQTDRASSPREVAAEVGDALAIKDEAIVLGLVGGVRNLICRALPQPSGVFLITPSPRCAGPRPHVGSAMAEAARLVAAEYDPRG